MIWDLSQKSFGFHPQTNEAAGLPAAHAVRTWLDRLRFASPETVVVPFTPQKSDGWVIISDAAHYRAPGL